MQVGFLICYLKTGKKLTSMEILSFREFLNEKLSIKLRESGNVFGGTSPIPAERQYPTFDVLKKEFFSVLGIEKDGWVPLGSTFKKKPGTSSGDMDFAINGLVVGAHLNIGFDEVPEKIEELFHKTFPKYESKFLVGDSILTTKFPQYEKGGKKTDEWVQIDLMIMDDLNLAEFLYHSPNFIENESQYKGVYRNMLLFNILNSIDIEEDIIYYKDEFDGKFAGEIKQFSKYSLTARDGLKKQIKSYDGKRGRKKNAAIVKGQDKIISKNVEEIVKFILGPDAKRSDLNSFESIWNWMFSDKFIHKHKRDIIIDKFIKSLINNNFPIPSEAADYI